MEKIAEGHPVPIVQTQKILSEIETECAAIGIPSEFTKLIRGIYERGYTLRLGEDDSQVILEPEDQSVVIKNTSNGFNIKDPVAFTAEAFVFYQTIAESVGTPVAWWYYFRRLPEAVHPHFIDQEKALESYGDPVEFLFKILDGCPSGDEENPEWWLRALNASLMGTIHERTTTNGYRKIGEIPQLDETFITQIAYPTYQWDELQDSPYEMRFASVKSADESGVLPEPEFTSRFHNIRFLPMGDTGVLLLAVQSPDLIVDKHGKSEREWAEELLNFTQEGFEVFNAIYNDLDVQHALGEVFVHKYEFKSKPIYYLTRFRGQLQTYQQECEQKLEVESPTLVVPEILTLLEQIRQTAEKEQARPDLEEKAREDFQERIIDGLKVVEEKLKSLTGEQLKGDLFSAAQVYHIDLANGWIGFMGEDITKDSHKSLKGLFGRLMPYYEYLLVAHAIGIITETLSNQDSKQIRALWQYQRRRENNRRLNNPFRGNGNPSARVSITSFVQSMYDLGYRKLFIHSEKNEFPKHSDKTIDKKVKTQKEWFVKFVLGLAESAGAEVRKANGGYLYEINFETLTRYLRSSSKYPTVTFEA